VRAFFDSNVWLAVVTTDGFCRSKAQVYLIRHRVAKALRAIVKRLEKKLG
jgi:hypothetical protein